MAKNQGADLKVVIADLRRQRSAAEALVETCAERHKAHALDALTGSPAAQKALRKIEADEARGRAAMRDADAAISDAEQRLSNARECEAAEREEAAARQVASDADELVQKDLEITETLLSLQVLCEERREMEAGLLGRRPRAGQFQHRPTRFADSLSNAIVDALYSYITPGIIKPMDRAEDALARLVHTTCSEFGRPVPEGALDTTQTRDEALFKSILGRNRPVNSKAPPYDGMVRTGTDLHGNPAYRFRTADDHDAIEA